MPQELSNLKNLENGPFEDFLSDAICGAPMMH